MNAESRLDARLRSTLERQSVRTDEVDTPSALWAVVRGSARRTRRRRVANAVGGVLVAALVVIGVAVVGPGGSPGRLEPASPAPPTGTWQRTVAESGHWSGRWSLTFSAGNVLALTTPDGLPRDQGTGEGASYAIRGDTLRLDAFSNGACLDQPAGTYRWTVDGDRLFLEVTDDPCRQRRHVFDGVWRPGL